MNRLWIAGTADGFGCDEGSRSDPVRALLQGRGQGLHQGQVQHDRHEIGQVKVLKKKKSRKSKTGM